jgi:hypothetical protein
MANEVNKVGMGVYIDDGATTLATLRAIRQEMEAIAHLSGRTPASGGTGGSQSRSMWEDELKAREAAELASIRRIARARQDVIRGVDPDETNLLARQKVAKINQTRAIKDEVARIEEQARQERASKDQREFDTTFRRKQAQMQRIAGYAKQFREGTLDPMDVFGSARSLQGRRNDDQGSGSSLKKCRHLRPKLDDKPQVELRSLRWANGSTLTRNVERLTNYTNGLRI